METIPEDKEKISHKTPKEGRDPLTSKLPNRGYLRDSIQSWNERTNKYEPGWEHRFNKRTEFTFFELTNAYETGPISSKSFYCAPYRNALLMIDLKDTEGAPTRFLLLCWFSWDNVNWFQFMEDAWGRMQWEDIDMPSKESYPIPILAPYIKFSYGISGGDVQSKYFPFKLSAIFNSV